MKDDSGILSIDFIAGFTIFMIAFIIVVTMGCSGSISSASRATGQSITMHLRTGPAWILTEDAGDPGGPGT